MAILLTIFLYAVWSSIFPLGKMALEIAPPIFLTSSRMLLAGVLIILYLLLKKRDSLKLSLKQIFSLLLLGLFSIYLTNVCEFYGLKHLTAAKTCFIYSLSPFFTALFSYIHFKEKMDGRKWLGLMIGFIGVLPVLMIQSGSENLLQAFSFISWPELAVMGAALFSVYGWVLLRLAVKNQTISPIAANGISMLFGGFLALIHSLTTEGWSPIPISLENLPKLTSLLLTMTLISNVLCYNLYGYLLKRYTATLLSFVGLLSPIFASVTSWFLIGEEPSWIIFLSTALIASGLYIVYQSELRQGYILKKVKSA
ncbi:MAG: DMT family transporter [Simkaniaceae bacterium]